MDQRRTRDDEPKGGPCPYSGLPVVIDLANVKAFHPQPICERFQREATAAGPGTTRERWAYEIAPDGSARRR